MPTCMHTCKEHPVHRPPQRHLAVDAVLRVLGQGSGGQQTYTHWRCAGQAYRVLANGLHLQRHKQGPTPQEGRGGQAMLPLLKNGPWGVFTVQDVWVDGSIVSCPNQSQERHPGGLKQTRL